MTRRDYVTKAHECASNNGKIERINNGPILKHIGIRNYANQEIHKDSDTAFRQCDFVRKIRGYYRSSRRIVISHDGISFVPAKDAAVS